jgi:transcriptional regulator with XRE-family HTH domain
MDLSVGSLVCNAREAAGYTQRHLASILGVSHVFVGEVERDMRRLPVARWAALCSALPTLTLEALAKATVEDAAMCDLRLTVRPGIAISAERAALVALFVRMAKVKA